MVMDMSQRIALIAGANVGVSRRPALALASDNHRLILAGRSIELTKSAPDEIHNLGNPEGGAKTALCFIESAKPPQRGQFPANSPPSKPTAPAFPMALAECLWECSERAYRS
jgi:NAD(P)-dependent dehydrogenase (short-subunit alcohol dehydrogenase family)